MPSDGALRPHRHSHHASRRPTLSQIQPDPGWYPDPAGSGGVRWWDGLGWTEHVAAGGDEGEHADDEVEEVAYIEVARAAKVTLVDDGELHARPREQVFAGSLRGSVPTIAERLRLDADTLLGLRGIQLAGAAALTLFFGWLGTHGLLGDGGGSLPGLLIWMGAALPVATWLTMREQSRQEWWTHWCVSRGFTPGDARGSDSIVPTGLASAPLVGPAERCVVERIATRELCGRRAVLATLLHLTPPVGVDPDDAVDARRTPVVHRTTCIALELSEAATARWPGACIRADHLARRPMALRSMLGALLPRPAVTGAHAHVSADPAQAHHLVTTLADDRLERYLAAHPLDADLVGGWLVVTRDGLLETNEDLEELCRDALVLHELVVPEHELPAAREAAAQAARDEQMRAQAEREAARDAAERAAWMTAEQQGDDGQQYAAAA
ncbi:MAG: hypothetical protein JWM86_2144 [Thermoleophilia bacterium]|nr:hypothetical protein [Thermoleophilia bacterium]